MPFLLLLLIPLALAIRNHYGRTLKRRYEKLGNPTGRSRAAIEASLRKTPSRIEPTPSGYWCAYAAPRYGVGIFYDRDDRCIGVSGQIDNTATPLIERTQANVVERRPPRKSAAGPFPGFNEAKYKPLKPVPKRPDER